MQLNETKQKCVSTKQNKLFLLKTMQLNETQQKNTKRNKTKKINKTICQNKKLVVLFQKVLFCFVYLQNRLCFVVLD